MYTSLQDGIGEEYTRISCMISFVVFISKTIPLNNAVPLSRISNFFLGAQFHFVVTIYYHCIVFLLSFNGNSICYR